MPDTTLEWLAILILCLMFLGVRLYEIRREAQLQRLRRQWKRDAPKRDRHRLWLRAQRDKYRKALAAADPDGPPVPLPAAFGGPRPQA